MRNASEVFLGMKLVFTVAKIVCSSTTSLIFSHGRKAFVFVSFALFFCKILLPFSLKINFDVPLCLICRFLIFFFKRLESKCNEQLGEAEIVLLKLII